MRVMPDSSSSEDDEPNELFRIPRIPRDISFDSQTVDFYKSLGSRRLFKLITIVVDRGDIFDSTRRALEKENTGKSSRFDLFVKFKDETGLDAGALKRYSITLIFPLGSCSRY
jgi:hypothetical protein